ncbi:hypothetical protein HPB50_024875 [Hyalomma asiaticum]|uniref:Uncharacterized protein n=1 Tax=Hyalomma asiaticum TaxID=266040 RepID=A0ACB7S558_HYAAI|nr:hypothetical protein HPB50_024875 [Hyalomma asiaticum]
MRTCSPLRRRAKPRRARQSYPGLRRLPLGGVSRLGARLIQVAGQDISSEEETAEFGWLPARSRGSIRGPNNSTSTDESAQASSDQPRSRVRQPVKAQVFKAGRMPPLPTEDIKIVNRPQSALHIIKIGGPVVTAAILQAAKLTDEESSEDTVCPNTQQNIVVVSTPYTDHADRYVRIRSIQVNGVTHEVNAYETAAEHTTKGVIRGIPLTDTPQQIYNNIVTARNPTTLAAEHIASTTTVIIAFDGSDVPYQVRYGSTLLPSSLYRKQIDICYQCGRLGHRMDVCPYPNNKICRGCGARNPAVDHNCDPKCSLCGGPHLTADKSCAARFKTPYVIRKRIGERRATSEAIYQQAGQLIPLHNAISVHSASVKIPVCLSITQQVYQQSPEIPEIAQLKRENATLRDLLTELMQEEAPSTPAAKKRALQEGASGQPCCTRLRPFWDSDGDIPPPPSWPTLIKTPSFGSGTAEVFTRNKLSSINTYANITAAPTLFYSKKPITPLPHSLVIEHSTPLILFARSPP